MMGASVSWWAWVALAGAAPGQAAPYAGQQARPIKALSAEETAAYLEGQGHGLAKAAELNHYPGPKHVLELAQPLGLTDEQRARVQSSFDAMHAEAVRLGREIVDAETSLDAMFAGGGATAAGVTEGIARIARLQGQLRAVHLLAHLETQAALRPEQVARYDRLRGYGQGDHRHH